MVDGLYLNWRIAKLSKLSSMVNKELVYCFSHMVLQLNLEKYKYNSV